MAEVSKVLDILRWNIIVVAEHSVTLSSAVVFSFRLL